MYNDLKCERGYALASVLYLVTILSLLAVSILSIKYFANKNALIEIAKVKSTYAAESGIAKALSLASTKDALAKVIGSGEPLRSEYPDGGESEVVIDPWGVFLRVHAIGSCGQVSSTLSAIAAELPDDIYKNALVFASSNNQLVMTGNSSIRGDVVTGPAGATTGTLRDRISPIKIPIEGNISKQPAPTLPEFDKATIVKQLRGFDLLLRQASSSIIHSGRSITLDANKINHFSLSEVPDSIERLYIKGDMLIGGMISRQERPLLMINIGRIRFTSNTQMSGLIAVTSASPIEIEKGVKIDQAIIYSEQSITVKEGAIISAQCIAPSITFESYAIARYPSILLSLIGNDPDSINQTIVLNDFARVDGFVGMFSSGNIIQPEPNIVINQNATVTGALFSDRKMTLDGTVIGTVLTRNFYFYEAPTTYLGWLRGGTIDRTTLPKGFLTPVGTSPNPHLGVLDWL